SVSAEIGGRTLTIETGRMAKQAHGSVYIKYGETSALVTAVSAHKPKEGLDFFPLTIEFQEKFYASGKIPGGFFKREARPSEWATLNARMVDRPLRPLFPDGYRHETQVVFTLLSYDGENEAECLSGVGASAALLISDIPFENAIATVRVGRVDGKFVTNPTTTEQEKSDINVLVSSTKDAIVMVEGGADFASEEDFLEALYYGFDEGQKIIALQQELRKLAGKEKRIFVNPKVRDEGLARDVKESVYADLEKAFSMTIKEERYAALEQAKQNLLERMLEKCPAGACQDDYTSKLKDEFAHAKKDYARKYTLESGKRIDGRDFNQIRKIETQVGILPRVHGSALFTRGETQALGIVTLGTGDDEQLIDSVRGKFNKRILLHYNFPPFSVGECGRFGGNSRREVGHGMLAERAVTAIIPEPEQFNYTIRMVSEVLESNGSSSMATVCASSMALMDAGVPIKAPVAGIAMGLMAEGDKVVILSDILGDEDHLGDMDFKICGTKDGLTAVQMDIKMTGVSKEIMKNALMQAREGRLHILEEMDKTIKTNREALSEHAPRITTIQVSTERIKDLIGPGGKHIKAIVAATGVKIDIEDSGKVNVASADPEATKKALDLIASYTAEPEVGRIYNGKVARVTDYGAFITIMPGFDGLCHISELDHTRVNQVTDIIQEGDEVAVKVLEIDRQGKVRLSRKAALPQGGDQAPNA
ncbi:polyribonucleotide nucleotidyltransferase, partial [bacterium]|nr:polyribonucleotide nucleotidyltransferase [bacterium]